jgi:hypothetical protein
MILGIQAKRFVVAPPGGPRTLQWRHLFPLHDAPHESVTSQRRVSLLYSSPLFFPDDSLHIPVHGQITEKVHALEPRF